MLMTYYTDNILYNKGIKQLPHFENLLHTFAMQYKIKVQGNVETVVLLSRETNPLTVEVRMEVETGEVKRMVGLDMHKAPNAVEQRKHEYHPCPPEKVEAIKDALRHFGLIAE